MKLSQFKVLTFDCYGTLIDWESGIINALRPLTDRVSRPLSRDEILQAHARYESRQQKWTPGRPYPAILASVYRRLAEEWGVACGVSEAENYGASVPSWPAFPDSAEALAYLKQHFKLVILSNVDFRSFSGSNTRLQVEFDGIYTAEDIGSYKPSPRNFEYMLEYLADLGLEKDDILHTAESLFHDHTPANAFGLASCWIYRRHAQQGFGATMDPGAMPRIDFQFTSMAELAEAHKRECAEGL
ncbi:haloacid dehalogenase type II [Acetobacter fallax]|uniref:Haloacid dehalogenase type II n=1 Tax=Acetobacter fallax TaxID=1737473 RepID=A0ABX0KCF3_9PROT|nr:haloacid dehalogenase type II [Acetobacter fallax]NHO36107.1 haloacid dehalogenase type II [Acetobacter fallax]